MTLHGTSATTWAQTPANERVGAPLPGRVPPDGEGEDLADAFAPVADQERLGCEALAAARERLSEIVKRNGSIFCLHDARENEACPDIRPTLEALRRLLPELASMGFHFERVSQILCPTN